jgi:GTP cyclohydrolase IA
MMHPRVERLREIIFGKGSEAVPESDLEVIWSLLLLIGENPERPGLIETPQRVLQAWKVFTSGYSQKPEDVLKTFEDGAEGYDEMVFQGALPFFSTCEHHLVAFFGIAHIGYLPNKKIVGLSKLSRLLDVFARRVTVQERITTQVADALMEHLSARGCGVVLQARHLCMESRGIQKVGTITMTSALRGTFKEFSDIRAEFMTLVQASSSGFRPL